MNTISIKQWMGIPEKSDADKWMAIRKRRFGKLFIRNFKDGRGFQMLIFGHMWISVMEGNFTTLESSLHPGGGCEYMDDCSVLWNEFALSFIDR